MTRLPLLLICLAFAARGAFHALTLPVWEGIDEYAHVAVVEHWLRFGTLPESTDPVAPEIVESLGRNPLPKELAYVAQASRLDLYEAQQPPLYYWIMLVPYRLALSAPMESRVTVLRLCSVLLATAGIYFGFLAARALFQSDTQALAVAGVMAIFPGLLTDVARVGNDALAFALFSALLWLLLQRPVPRIAGLVLAAGLLTKAIFLIAIPVLIGVWLARRMDWKRAAAIAGLPAVLSGWWYVLIHQRTGSWSGWNETTLPGVNAAAIAHGFFQVDWINAIQVAFGSWLWFGDWSFLTVRRWMYAVFAVLFLVAAIGLAGQIRRFAIPLALVLSLTVAMAYNVVVTYLNHHISATTGWYFSVLLAAEMALLVAGLSRFAGVYAALVATSLFALLDAYATWFVSLPHYAGLAAHHPFSPLFLSRMRNPWAVPLWLAASALLLIVQYRLCVRLYATLRLQNDNA